MELGLKQPNHFKSEIKNWLEFEIYLETLWRQKMRNQTEYGVRLETMQPFEEQNKKLNWISDLSGNIDEI
jgi:hypothetical protein